MNVSREELATVDWPRILDTAPLTLQERRVIGKIWQAVVGPNDEIAADARKLVAKRLLGR